MAEPILEKAKICGHQCFNQFDRAIAMALFGDPIHSFLQAIEGVLHRNRTFAQSKKSVIILRVADSNDIMG